MRILLAALVLVLVGIGGWAGTLKSQERVPMAKRELLSIEGGLSRYESEQRLVWIKTDDSGEMQFSFAADTTLVGANRQLQVGDRLKVFYEVEGKINKAIRVEVVSDPAPTS